MDSSRLDSVAAAFIDEGQSLTRAEKRDHAVQRILDAARQCFVEAGFQGASMQQICAACGMSPGALYRYFPSKEAIITAITENDRREDAEMFSSVLDNPDVVEGIIEAAMAHVRNVRERHLAPLFAEIRAESMRNEAINATCMMHRGEVAERFQAHLALAVERGDIDPVVDQPSLLAMFMTIGEGLALNDLLALGVPDSHIETMLRAMVVGMLRPTGRKPSKNDLRDFR
jgi:AcrR family transcriptional regulator